ncbi:sugar ABC transporter permease [Treponema lecithinolyticum]|uniref:ABC transporter, permease protein n=1 Tax=Treponema lecithinolyticum ATCC 700332 TaxID=1321815 RepID=A0ABN0NZP6_TRELE|nr:ABC transporter permease subunit [Treponema lecithinolyticum]ERJ93548.1 ABC transporter, permease protein [Treponema lecithinolyticum ATCC 700332]
MKNFAAEFRKNGVLTLLAVPALILMVLFRYLPIGGIILAFKRFSIPKGIFGSPWIGFNNFKFLFLTKDAFIITRNTLCYNAVFIVLNLICAVTLAIALNELLNKKAAKIYQTIFMAPYFLSWVAISFIAFAFLNKDGGLLNMLLRKTGAAEISWYSETAYWPLIIIIAQLWKNLGYATVMYLSSLVNIPQELYEAALVDGATKWQQICKITLPALRPMMIILTIIAIGRIFYSDFGLFYQLPRNSGPLFDVTNVIDTYVYRTLKDLNDIGMAAAANLYQSLLGFLMIMGSNAIIKKIDSDSALF